MGCGPSSPSAKLNTLCAAPTRFQSPDPARVRDLLADPLMDVEYRDRFGRTSLELAARHGHTDAARQLINAKASLEGKCKPESATVLVLAAFAGHAEIVKALVEAGADKEAVDGNNCTAIGGAAMRGKADVIKVLIDAGANKEAPCQGLATLPGNKAHTDRSGSINQTVTYGFTPLTTAASSGHLEAIKMLCEKGAEIEAADVDVLLFE